MNAPVVIAIAVIVVVFAGLAYAAFAVTRRIAREDEDVRFFDALKVRGALPPSPGDPAAMRAGAQALRRCLACSAKRACDLRLVTGSWPALREICPNQAYIDSLPTL